MLAILQLIVQRKMLHNYALHTSQHCFQIQNTFNNFKKRERKYNHSDRPLNGIKITLANIQACYCWRSASWLLLSSVSSFLVLHQNCAPKRSAGLCDWYWLSTSLASTSRNVETDTSWCLRPMITSGTWLKESAALTDRLAALPATAVELADTCCPLSSYLTHS